MVSILTVAGPVVEGVTGGVEVAVEVVEVIAEGVV